MATDLLTHHLGRFIGPKAAISAIAGVVAIATPSLDRPSANATRPVPPWLGARARAQRRSVDLPAAHKQSPPKPCSLSPHAAFAPQEKWENLLPLQKYANNCERGCGL